MYTNLQPLANQNPEQKTCHHINQLLTASDRALQSKSLSNSILTGENRPYIRDGRAPIPEKEITSKVMSSIRAKNTKPELVIRKALWQEGIRGYRLHWKKAPGRPDIAFPKRKIAIFVNGCFWHRCPHCQLSTPKSHSEFWKTKFEKNVARDKKKTELLISEGWKVLTIWECQISSSIKSCVGRIKRILKKTKIQ